YRMVRNANAILGVALLGALVVGSTASARPPDERDVPSVELSAARTDLATSDDVVVRFTLTNGSGRPVDVYLWQTPFGEIENDLFSVTRDGEPVAYLGIVAKRAEPTAEDFVRIGPGRSRSADVELSSLYDMSRPGNYAVEYRAALSGVLPSMAAPSGAYLGSNLVTFRLTGEARPSPLALSQAVAPEAATTTYQSCSNAQISDLTQARPAAANYASSASSSLTGSATARYTTWFGAYTSSRYNTVKSHYAAISSALSTQAYTFDCKCKKPYYAYVYPTQPYIVYLCKVFWTAPMTGTDSKAGTLIHETSHFNVVASTDDWVYGQSGCKSLAQSDPNKAIDNADSHEYYAENNPPQ
ncbi:MAG TPA: M35 family metallo-endopeptidase, partial [Thermoanaerobaculia bacterium]|nr:M35 family metallo-endopeptidase [Thermoanaerobaculia bacterium]